MSAAGISRRAVLAAAGGGCALAALTACSPRRVELEPIASSASELRFALGDLPVGAGGAAKLDGASIVITRTADDAVHAYSAVCTHEGCIVKAEGDTLRCPCHGSQFDPATGAATHGPAEEPLTRLRASIDGDEIVVTA